MWQAIMEGDFWATLDPLPGAREVLAGLARQRDAGDDIYFLTARPGRYAKQFTEWWLEGQGYDCPTVLISRDKGSVCQGLKVEFFIDDKPENCREVKAYCPRTEVFLLDRPHNRSFVVTPFATRVQSILDPRLLEIPQDVA